MEVLSKQKPMCNRDVAIQCQHPRFSYMLTALMTIFITVHGCYGDQIKRDPNDIDTSLNQVQFKAYHRSRETFNIGVTVHDRPLLRDETIKNDHRRDEISSSSSSAASARSTSRRAHILVNKSNRSIKSNNQKTTSAVQFTATTSTPSTNYQYDAKRDPHRNIHQSQHIIRNAGHLKTFTQYKYAFDNSSDVINREHFTPRQRQHQQQQKQQHHHAKVSNIKPKISAKLFYPSTSYDRKTTYLSYNLDRDQVQNTINRLQSTTANQSPELPSNTVPFQQSSKGYVYRTVYRPIQRNNCNRCRIIPGVPQRHKPFLPNRVRYYGRYSHLSGGMQRIDTHRPIYS